MNEVELNSVARGREAAIPVNKVLRNTYLLLSMTLFFSAICAVATMMLQVSQGMGMVMLIGGFITSFVVQATARSAKGLFWVFVFAGLMGGALGPVISAYLQVYANGSAIVAQALGGTALIFLSLSGYVLATGKNFSYLGGFLMTGLIVAIVAMIANIFLQIPALSLAISSAVILIMSGFILFDTSRIINGGERNYILATISLYISIFNIFVHLLNLLGALTGRD
ncbi:MAG: Bax inhibitor-1/YccA family protein [Gammaproteobacteria bacterium]|nr:Bax inhibitor-1/YccA family protein [Pseudomonadales bacterium]MCP5346202.1 Bax inhibitor-1/YccA family protein [Pseudomonadales bacterium]